MTAATFVFAMRNSAALVFIGLQPPNDVLRVYGVMVVLGLAATWFGLGPRRADIEARERAVGETA